MLFAATQPNPWQWQPHPEVWLLVGLVIGLGLYVSRVIQPTMVAAGHPPITRRQKGFFVAGVIVLWLAADWPLHDLGERYLFFLHMIQHLVLSLILPPLFLFSIPTWLARLVVGHGRFGHRLLRLARPVVAGLAFNLFVAVSHAPTVVDHAVRIGPLHYLLHLTLVGLAFLMWIPVCGPLPELRIAIPGQCAYLFLMSVLPTIPAAWLTFADNAVYKAYDIPYRLWDITVAQDQQAAGLIMKIGGGAYLWTLITILFFKWAARHEEAERAGRLVSEREVLTWERVSSELATLPPGPNPDTPTATAGER